MLAIFFEPHNSYKQTLLELRQLVRHKSYHNITCKNILTTFNNETNCQKIIIFFKFYNKKKIQKSNYRSLKQSLSKNHCKLNQPQHDIALTVIWHQQPLSPIDVQKHMLNSHVTIWKYEKKHTQKNNDD